jgi:hypothetical protein
MSRQNAHRSRWDQLNEVFDSTAEYKRLHGWKGYRTHAIEGDNNHLLVMEEFETDDQVREFLGSEYLREALSEAGVSAGSRHPGGGAARRRQRVE